MLACRLRGAAPSLAKELQGAVGEGARAQAGEGRMGLGSGGKRVNN